MHDIEHKSEQNDSAVEVTPLQPQEKRTFTPAQNGSTTAGGRSSLVPGATPLQEE